MLALLARAFLSRPASLARSRPSALTALVLAGAAGIALLAVQRPAAAWAAVPLIGIGCWSWSTLLLASTRFAADRLPAAALIQTTFLAAAALAPLVAAGGHLLLGSQATLWLLAAATTVSATMLGGLAQSRRQDSGAEARTTAA